MASEAFEISSRRKISLLLYSEWTIRSRICTTSAWKLKLSCSACALTAVLAPVASCSVGNSRSDSRQMHAAEQRPGPGCRGGTARARFVRSKNLCGQVLASAM